VNTVHRFPIPAANYDIDGLVTALNSVDPPFPSLLRPVWDFTDDRVKVSTALAYPLFRVLSVIEDRGSTLAPTLGFHGYTVAARFFVSQTADTQPGLYGLVNAYLHCRPIATGSTVGMSSIDTQSLEVSIFGEIPVSNVPFGSFAQHDFSRSGESYMMRFESQDRDLSRIQVRIRDHSGNLLELGHPGIVLYLKCFFVE
jgi:hypothetical protein